MCIYPSVCEWAWSAAPCGPALQRGEVGRRSGSVSLETHTEACRRPDGVCRGAAATAASLALGRFVFLPFQRDNAKRQGLGKQNGVTHPEAGDKFAQEASFALNTNDPAGFNLIDVFAWGAVRGRPWTQRQGVLPSLEVHLELQRMWLPRDLLPLRQLSCLISLCVACVLHWQRLLRCSWQVDDGQCSVEQCMGHGGITNMLYLC